MKAIYRILRFLPWLISRWFVMNLHSIKIILFNLKHSHAEIYQEFGQQKLIKINTNYELQKTKLNKFLMG